MRQSKSLIPVSLSSFCPSKAPSRRTQWPSPHSTQADGFVSPQLVVVLSFPLLRKKLEKPSQELRGPYSLAFLSKAKSRRHNASLDPANFKVHVWLVSLHLSSLLCFISHFLCYVRDPPVSWVVDSQLPRNTATSSVNASDSGSCSNLPVLRVSDNS